MRGRILCYIFPGSPLTHKTWYKICSSLGNAARTERKSFRIIERTNQLNFFERIILPWIGTARNGNHTSLPRSQPRPQGFLRLPRSRFLDVTQRSPSKKRLRGRLEPHGEEETLNLSEVSRFYLNPFTFVGYRNNHSILIFRTLGNSADAHISRLGYLWWNTTRRATAIGFIIKSTTLLVQYTFLYISSPLLHDYDMKFLQLTFYGGRKHARTNFSFSL